MEIFPETKERRCKIIFFLCSLNVLFNWRVMLVKYTLYFWELVFIKTIILQKEFFVLIFKDYSWLLLLSASQEDDAIKLQRRTSYLMATAKDRDSHKLSLDKTLSPSQSQTEIHVQ